MKILNFIEVTRALSDGGYSVAVTGECYIPCETPVPVIQKGKKCIGIGIVRSLTITAESTDISFNLSTNVSKEKKQAYYDLYRNNVSAITNSDDPYENTDQIIPGAMVGKKNRTPERLCEMFDNHEFF